MEAGTAPCLLKCRIGEHIKFANSPLQHTIAGTGVSPKERLIEEPWMAGEFDDVSRHLRDPAGKEICIEFLAGVDDADEPIIPGKGISALTTCLEATCGIEDEAL